MRTLGIVPARAGSKGIVGKNKRLFRGKPLVAWSIEVARATCDRVLVTSDDPDILAIAEEYEVEALVRPAELATDETAMYDVLSHALACQTKPVDAVVLLQPTTPLRTPEQVKRAIALLLTSPDRDSVVSVVPIPAHMSPDYACKIEGGMLSWFIPGNKTRRQDCRPAFYRDGTVYVIRADIIRHGRLYGRCLPMLVDIDESVTIDDESDWVKAESLVVSNLGV